MKIYHNPRCSKSRQTLAIIEEHNKEVEIIKYLEDVPTEQTLKALLEKLGMEPLDLVRKNEPIWKTTYKNKELTNDQILKALVEHPKLIERPIVVKGDKAIIGRPPENVITLF